MREDETPIFPRSTEISEEEKQRIYWETRRKLENSAITPPLNPASSRNETIHVMPAYGPPVFPVRNWIPWIILGFVLGVLLLLVGILVFKFVA